MWRGAMLGRVMVGGVLALTATACSGSNDEDVSATSLVDTTSPQTTEVSSTTSTSAATTTVAATTTTTSTTSTISTTSTTSAPTTTNPSATTEPATTSTPATTAPASTSPPFDFPNADLLLDPDALPFQNLGDAEDWIVESEFWLVAPDSGRGFVRGVSGEIDRNDGIFWSVVVVEWASAEDAARVIDDVVAAGGTPGVAGDVTAGSVSPLGFPTAIGAIGDFTVVVGTTDAIDAPAVHAELERQLALLATL